MINVENDWQRLLSTPHMLKYIRTLSICLYTGIHLLHAHYTLTHKKKLQSTVYKPRISASWRFREEDQEFKGSQDYIVRTVHHLKKSSEVENPSTIMLYCIYSWALCSVTYSWHSFCYSSCELSSSSHCSKQALVTQTLPLAFFCSTYSLWVL